MGGVIYTHYRQKIIFYPFEKGLSKGDYVRFKTASRFHKLPNEQIAFKTGGLMEHKKFADNQVLKLNARVSNVYTRKENGWSSIRLEVLDTGQIVYASGIFDKPLKVGDSYEFEGRYALSGQSVNSRSFCVTSVAKMGLAKSLLFSSVNIGRDFDLAVRKRVMKDIVSARDQSKDFESFRSNLKDYNIVCRREYASHTDGNWQLRYFFEHDGKAYNICASDLSAVKCSYGSLIKYFNGLDKDPMSNTANAAVSQEMRPVTRSRSVSMKI